jgi:putative PIN family toxin of toxin-antitoxin system
MIRAILDTNVVVQATMSSGASAQVLDAYYDNRFVLITSPATIDELVDVMLISRISQKHGMSEDEVLEFAATLQAGSERFLGTAEVAASIPRDATDSKLLGLAMESTADFLVTNDHRHLLRLGTFGQTQIIRPNEFLQRVATA